MDDFAVEFFPAAARRAFGRAVAGCRHKPRFLHASRQRKKEGEGGREGERRRERDRRR